MMIKVGSEYLEFNGDIEIERQAKIFEELSDSAGDFSYEFEIDLTSNNIRILGFPFPDHLSKNVYHKINCEIISDSGVQVYSGFLRIERIIGYIANVSFFSGNNNWFGLLSGPLSDIDFSDMDTSQDESTIVASWSADEGLVFPLVDNGVLMDRKTMQLKVEDFVPAVYVHTVISRIFQKYSIKLQGELFKDPNYKRLIVMKSPADETESRSSYVGKTSLQNIGFPAVLLTFDDDSNFPFFDGSLNNYSTTFSEYVADIKMRVVVDVSATFINGTLGVAKLYIVKNGVEFINTGAVLTSTEKTLTLQLEVLLNPGDNITISAECNGGGADIENATVRITPTYLYSSFGNTSLPDWTQQEFVSNVFQLFNVIPSFDSKSKVLTVNLFEKVNSKTPIDISEFVSSMETDYAEFVSNYGKRANAFYNEIEFDDWLINSVVNYFPSGSGAIDIDNDFLEDSSELIDSDFSNPQSYINSVFDMSIERMPNLELEAVEDTIAETIEDSPGTPGIARFNVDEDIFTVGDLVEISLTSVNSYAGDWVVATVGAGWVEFHDLVFDIDTTAILTVMKHVYTSNDEVFLLFNVPNYSVPNFSSGKNIRLEATLRTSIAMAYFNLINVGKQVNEDFIQSLSFGEVDSQLFYQRTMLQTYWNLAGRVLNDPVKQNAIVNLPNYIFDRIDFLSPITVRSIETSNLYYPNKVSGYKGPEFDSVIELIKLP